MDLSSMPSAARAIAIDTKKAYAEISLGDLSATDQTWNAPYQSDWAIAVGPFELSGTEPLQPPQPPTGDSLQIVIIPTKTGG